VIPVHPELAAVLEATPSDHLTFLTTATGKPFSAARFTNWFRDMCNEAGLPKGTSAHGLGKAACRRLAEAGCSANVIAAISGHATLREVQRYTAAADQARMGDRHDGRRVPIYQNIDWQTSVIGLPNWTLTHWCTSS
jgi:integrase